MRDSELFPVFCFLAAGAAGLYYAVFCFLFSACSLCGSALWAAGWHFVSDALFCAIFCFLFSGCRRRWAVLCCFLFSVFCVLPVWFRSVVPLCGRPDGIFCLMRYSALFSVFCFLAAGAAGPYCAVFCFLFSVFCVVSVWLRSMSGRMPFLLSPGVSPGKVFFDGMGAAACRFC